MPEYGSASYWEQRYRSQNTDFDWYLRFDHFKHIVAELANPSSQILVIGCGNSTMSADMYNEGFTNITNIDISDTVIKNMREKYSHLEGMTWHTMDVRKMPQFTNQQFDLVIDKGTTDAILCGNNSFRNAELMNREIFRLLKVGGHFVVISYGLPETRLDLFNKPNFHWKVDHKMVEKPLESKTEEALSTYYYVYVMEKLDDTVPAEDPTFEFDDELDDEGDRDL